MPYSIIRRGSQYCVVRDATDGRSQKRLGCHDSRKKAERQREAIEANEDD